MQTETCELLWLDQSGRVSLNDLVDLSALSEADLNELVESGALVPDHPALPWRFSAACVVTVRVACRLRDELELDPHAVILALTLLERIRLLEAEIARLRARQPAYR